KPGTISMPSVQIAHEVQKQGAAAGIAANCCDGQRYVFNRGIGSEQELLAALKQNDVFRSRYEHDLAFNLGVRSAIWAESHRQSDVMRQTLGAPAAPASFEARG